ncbi:vWA domain-containing protein [Methylobacterium sp. JK268]
MSEAVTLLRPWWLLALPLLVLLGWRVALRAAPLGDWARAIEPHLLAGLAARGAVLPGRRRVQGALLAIGAVLALALTGPAVQSGDAAGFRNLDATILVMDLSRSVAEGGRLDAARGVAQSLAEAAGSRQVALVVYAGDAYVAATPTTDRDALGTVLFALDGATVPERGSNPARGLALARRTLSGMGAVAADVVLLSDGGGVDAAARREAAGLTGDGHRLHTLFVPTPALPPEAPPPDRAALDRLAAAGGGVAATVDAPASVLASVGETTARHLAAGGLAVLAWEDLGRWLLLAALPPALLLFRRRA